MYPILFEIGPLRIGMYGVMLALGFLGANFLYRRTLAGKGIDPAFADRILFLAIIGGIIGSKGLFLLENFSDFVRDPFRMIFSGGGFTAYGGYIVAMALAVRACRKYDQSVGKVFDGAAAPLAFGYAMGRVGCQFAGDECYGIPTDLPWAMAYPKGIIPTTELVHPTPVYEFLYSLVLCAIFLLIGPKLKRNWDLFFIYLILTGVGRFFVEFIRRNERILFNLTISQIAAIVMILVGIVGLLVRPKPAVASR